MGGKMKENYAQGVFGCFKNLVLSSQQTQGSSKARLESISSVTKALEPHNATPGRGPDAKKAPNNNNNQQN
eukprot:976621-Pelagomonas_calceolata.AAC.4